ncbi:hypothetical protein WA158_006360 [Blastocystis sp. Blastoise]
MSEELSEDKYLFTFQDETKLWISREFIEKYTQFSFYDIVTHSDKYDDGSYYIDMLPFHMEKVINFLMEDNIVFSTLDLKNGYDIYKTLLEYHVIINDEFQCELLFYVKELFYKYLNDNNYCVDGSYSDYVTSRMPMDLFSSKRISISIKGNSMIIIYNTLYTMLYIGLLTPQRKDELFYYSLLIKMMNINKVYIKYDYASNIPLEYICPSCIQDIFPCVEELYITGIYIININKYIIAITHYKKTELLLNPNSDEYIMEYIRLFDGYNYRLNTFEKYDYYTESEMNEYNNISSLDLNHLYYSNKLIDSYYEKREKNELPKLYKYIINEAIYTNDYSNVKINKTKDRYTLHDEVKIKYNDKTNDKTLIINGVSSEYGISQLLLLPSYLSISKIILIKYWHFNYDSVVFVKLFEEGLFDSSTVLNVAEFKESTQKIDENLFNKIMTTHVFPNVTELIYNDNDCHRHKSFKLSLLKKECFPKLHIINYDIEITTKNFESLFPTKLISMIDTIHIYDIDLFKKEEVASLLDKYVYTHSIHIDIFNNYGDQTFCHFPHLNELLERNFISFDSLLIDSSRSESMTVLDSIGNNKQNIDYLNISFKNNNPEEIDQRDSLKRFLNSNVLQHLNDLTIFFDDGMSIDSLAWISTLFNDNKFNTIHTLTISRSRNTEDLYFEYFSTYENILEKLIPKASIVRIEVYLINKTILLDRYMSFKSQLIPKGCFHNTTQLVIGINDILDENFLKLYTIDNFPQLKYIKFYKEGDGEGNREWWSSFIKTFCTYMNNNNFQSSSIVCLGEWKNLYNYDYIYDPKTSIFRYKYDSNSFMNTIIVTDKKEMNKYEIETLFDCINENKTQNIRSLNICIYDEEQLSKLTNFITTGKIPKLEELVFNIEYDLYKKIGIYEKQLSDWSYKHNNYIRYKFDKIW